MIDQVSGALKSLYVLVCFGAFLLFAAVYVVRTRSNLYNKAWAPLRPAVHGTVRSQPMTSTLSGEYHGHTVRATIARGGQGLPDTFTVEMPAGPGGRDWEIARRPEKFLGPETWRASTQDPALQSRLDAAQAGALLKGWSEQASVRYVSRGMLALREEIFSPSAEHFRAQLDLLERLAEVNRKVNPS